MQLAVVLCLAVAVCAPGAASAAPEGQMTWAVHITIAPTGFDPAETPGMMFAPIIEPAFLNGVEPQVAMHGLGAVGNSPYSSPYKDLKLKAK